MNKNISDKMIADTESKDCKSELFAIAIEKCIHTSHSGLIRPVCDLFEGLKNKGETLLISELVRNLTPLGLNPESPIYSWNSEPPKERLISQLCQFQEKVDRVGKPESSYKTTNWNFVQDQPEIEKKDSERFFEISSPENVNPKKQILHKLRDNYCTKEQVRTGYQQLIDLHGGNIPQVWDLILFAITTSRCRFIYYNLSENQKELFERTCPEIFQKYFATSSTKSNKSKVKDFLSQPLTIHSTKLFGVPQNYLIDETEDEPKE